MLTTWLIYHFGWGKAVTSEVPTLQEGYVPEEILSQESSDAATSEDATDGILYRWDDQGYDWVPLDEYEIHPVTNSEEVKQLPTINKDGNEVIKLDWGTLNDILYRQQYYPSIEMSMYAPVFSNTLKNLDGKTVEIAGHIIPIEEEAGIWVLSAYPVASCFFCGQASPASILSLYMREDAKRFFKAGEYGSFRGTLVLNSDNPEDFYYILTEAYVQKD